MDIRKLNTMQSTLQKAIDEKVIAGANGMVLQHGKEQYYFEAGYASIEKQTLISRETIFRLYSMSKPVTGAAVMILLEQGMIDLLDPVSKYLPGFSHQKVASGDTLVPVGREMTIKDLLSMTSGLVYGDGSSKAGMDTEAVFKEIDANLYKESALSTNEAMNKLGRCALAFQPGSHWCYGTSADVLGAIVEVVSGIRFGEFLDKMIFVPLGMEDTGFYVPDDKQHRLAYTYQEKNSSLELYNGDHLGIQSRMNHKPEFESGGAGLVSTIDDYAKFAQMLLGYGTLNGVKILSPKTVEYFTANHLNPVQQADMAPWIGLAGYSYGNLMRVMTDPGLAVMMGTKGEYGWDGWLGTYFFNDPVNDFTFLFMLQKTDAGTLPLTRRLRNIVFSSLE